MLVHVAMHAVDGTLLVRDWEEAGALWRRVSTATHSVAVAVMPNHLHVLLHDAEVECLRTAGRAFALWRNAHRRESGPVWRPGARPIPLEDPRHLSRTHRYILLNPCREGLVDDPLAWPFTTLRDALGLAWPGARPKVRDPERFLRWASSDFSTRSEGVPFPRGLDPERLGTASIDSLRRAVSSFMRAPLERFGRRGAERALLVRCCARYTSMPSSQVAAKLGLSAMTLRRARHAPPHTAEEGIALVLDDPRFRPLVEGRCPWLSGRRRQTHTRPGDATAQRPSSPQSFAPRTR